MTKKIRQLRTWLKKRPVLSKALFAGGLTFVIFLVFLPVILSFKRIGWYDWDYFVSYHEAVRRIIVNFHQFPWWDPWIAGGAPLFANPQNGLLSIETPFILLFGTIFGLKLAAFVYFVAGFWGMYWLLKELKTQLAQRILLSYIWIFSTFVTFHFFPGHFTFLMYLLCPWLFFLTMRLFRDPARKWPILLGVFIGFIINSDLHYMVVQSFIILFFWIAVQFFTSKHKKRVFFGLLIAGGIALVMSLFRMLFAYQYVSQFPSLPADMIKQTTSIATAARAFLRPFQKPDTPMVGMLIWWEISAYVGLGAIIVFCLSCLSFCKDIYRQKKLNLGIIFVAGFLVCLVIGLGPFARLSPYNVLGHIPIFKSMQVPTRWFGWSIFFMILAMSQFKKLPRLTVVLLTLAVLELIIIQPLGRIFKDDPPQPLPNSSFQQHDDFGLPHPGTSNMYQGIISNYGVFPAYEALLNRSGTSFARCSPISTPGCKMVTDNAKIIYWSPNVIKLQRTAKGPISLNINPSSYWVVNGKRIFANERVTEPGKQFVIDDPSTDITLEIKPRL